MLRELVAFILECFLLSQLSPKTRMNQERFSGLVEFLVRIPIDPVLAVVYEFLF